MRGKRLDVMDGDEVLRRAQSQIGLGIHYSLRPGENGGADPAADTCAPRGMADCVGLALWAVGIDRWQPEIQGLVSYGGYINCNSIFKVTAMPGKWVFDAMFRCLFAGTGEAIYGMATAGDIIVAPGSGGKHGHMGIASTTGRMIHCSPFNYHKDSTPGAVDETHILSGKGRRGPWSPSKRLYVLRRIA